MRADGLEHKCGIVEVENIDSVSAMITLPAYIPLFHSQCEILLAGNFILLAELLYPNRS